jgi:hypothetical protein
MRTSQGMFVFPRVGCSWRSSSQPPPNRDPYLRVLGTLSQKVDAEEWHSSSLWIVRSTQGTAVDEGSRSRRDKRTERRMRQSLVHQSTTTQRLVKLTESARVLYAEAELMSSNFQRVITIELAPAITIAFAEVFEFYETHLAQVSEHDQRELSDPQLLAILANSSHVSSELVPVVFGQIELKLGRTLRDFDTVRRNLTALHVRLCDLWCSRRAEALLRDHLPWAEMTYEEPDADTTSQYPETISQNFINFFAALSALRNLVKDAMGSRAVKPLILVLVEEVALRLREAPHIGTEANVALRSAAKLHQLVLDVKFFTTVAAATEGKSKQVSEAAAEIIDAAVFEFQRRNGKDFKLKDDAWFARRLTKAFEIHWEAIGLNRR